METGCPKACNFDKYKISRHVKEKISWNTTRWLSEFYIYPIYDKMEIRQVFREFKVEMHVLLLAGLNTIRMTVMI